MDRTFTPKAKKAKMESVSSGTIEQVVFQKGITGKLLCDKGPREPSL